MRNSWGSGWCDGGYGWISYHDPTIGKANAQFIGSDVNNYSGIYQYDPAGTSSSLGYNASSMWGGNVFTATEDANLTAVGFYTNDLSAAYNVRIYNNPTTGPVGATILSQKSGTIPMSGYHTIPLDTPVRLSTGDIFSIVLNLVNPSYGYPLAIENPATGPVGNNWTANPGEGYYGSNGITWADIVSWRPNVSICIKGYTDQITSPPVANFTAHPTSGAAPLTVQFTDTSTGDPTSWIWQFGDGSGLNAQNPLYTYAYGGNYTVNLTVANEGGSDTKSVLDYIQVTGPVPVPPVASFTSNVTTGQVPLPVQFTDTSGADPIWWLWEFGDGANSSVQNPVHVYTLPGSYTVNLTASNPAGCNLTSIPGYITATGPVAYPYVTGIYPNSGQVGTGVSYTITGNNLTSGALVNLTKSSQSNISSIGTLAGSNLTGTFQLVPGTATGFWNVSVNQAGRNSNDDVQFSVLPAPTPVLPVAAFSGTPRSGPVPLTVQFTDESLNSPTSWLWDFDDGSSSTVQNPAHIFTTPGLFTVSLQVSNLVGSNISAKQDYINATGPLGLHNITATAGTGGSINPFGLVQVPHGGNQVFTIQPNTHNEISSVSVDGQVLGPLSTYTFTNVVSDHQITATFNRIMLDYIINATSDRFTYVHPYGLKVYPEGANASYYSGATPGSVLEKVIVDGTSLEEPVKSYSFTDIESDHTIATEGNITPGSIHVSFSASPMTGSAPLNVQFTDQTLGDPVSWYWDFGDGKVSRDQHPEHIYTSPGSYTVQLRVFGETSGGYKSWNNAIIVR